MRRHRRKKHPIDNFPPDPSSETIDPFAPLPSLGTQFLCIATPELSSSTALIGHVSQRRSLSEFIRGVEALMTWHQWEFPLLASVGAVN